MQKITLPHNAWFRPREVVYSLPETWEVRVHNIAGYNKPALSKDQIQKTVLRPTGMPPLREMAKGRKEAVILFDDLTRGTVAAETAYIILDELKKAGITEGHIRFIAAVANHHALTRVDLVKKLGEEIVRRFPVFNHCPFINCQEIGKTSHGTIAEINSEVMYCDLKIAIGQILPHPIYGLSGGAKMIMPGVSSYRSVLAHHGRTHQAWRQERMDRGMIASDVVTNNPFRDDAMEIAKMAGLDMVVNATIDRLGKTAALFAGALEPTHAAAAKAAIEHYRVENTKDNDIVIVNNFIKASEFMVPLAAGARALGRDGGSVVVADNAPGGQVVHYLMDNFGTTIAGDLCMPIIIEPKVKQLIIYNRYPEGRLRGRFQNPEKVMFATRWGEVTAALKKMHGTKAKVAVYPNADTQIYPEYL